MEAELEDTELRVRPLIYQTYSILVCRLSTYLKNFPRVIEVKGERSFHRTSGMSSNSPDLLYFSVSSSGVLEELSDSCGAKGRAVLPQNFRYVL
ncbi:hypothetical protein AVEN_69599-1 [Araneus ventricosus]|uniref:Uncharacterized protein n=1 Tax=Araneus ventricosus TaxID=182803 RepID=A0A4Y2HQ32_ARAVE|nr:hypothetical protein AVEN_69599-1 [Araneus ventricosus]